MFEIPFTQYLLQNGRKKAVTWECTSHEQEVKARALLDAGAKFYVELLMTGDVSLTCEIVDNRGEDQTLAHEVCSNNEDVIQAVAHLVERAHENLIKDSLDNVL